MIQSIRGMNDILPEKTVAWQKLETVLRKTVSSYGYDEIRFPIVENTALFKRAIGEVTDIVEKEMYTFTDRNGDSLSLRPEGTASCVRACIQNNLLYNQTQRLWYNGPMFRHERPQKGRYRQFSHFGVETFGFPDIDIELEVILITSRLLEALGLKDYVTLEINTLGTLSERENYKKKLVSYLKTQSLDEENLKRLESNPLRILDTKNPAMLDIIASAPRLIDCLNESRPRFENLCELLKKHAIHFKVNSQLVRGLDYYNDTVFEWVTHNLGSQGTVCAGGRYDSLVSQLGGNSCPAFGFAIGVDRLLLLLEEIPVFMHNLSNSADIYCIFMSTQAETEGKIWLEELRDKLSLLPLNYRIMAHCGTGSIKSQWKKADKSGALVALILGDTEISKQVVGIKFLRDADAPQIELEQNKVASFLKIHFEEKN